MAVIEKTEKGLIGVECGLCHEETFHVTQRQVLVTVNCCRRCAVRVDAEQQEQADSQALKELSKADRKLAMKEMSREWARSWAGKHVTMTYDVTDGGGCFTEILAEGCHIKGRAFYGSLHEDIGWGRVKVVLDESELYRVSMFEETIPRIDGFRWGLGRKLITHRYEYKLEQPLAFYVNWGDRNFLVLEEVDEEAEALTARREEERLRLEREKEIERHLGEGI